jgi:plasmid stabilization system protein ParE
VPERFAGKAYLHEEADAEFVEASRRYDVESNEVGAAFEAEVERGVAWIVEHPEASPVARGQVRRKVLRRPFPYSLFYVIETDRIRVLAVAHHKRRPGYWAHRL